MESKDVFEPEDREQAERPIPMKPIGYVRTSAEQIPRHWSISREEGDLVIHEAYREGLRDIAPGQRVVVLFHFDRSPAFTSEHLVQTPPRRQVPTGVFSTCSPIRPNPIGFSVLEVLHREGLVIRVRGIDMLDGTPLLDIKPHIESSEPE